MPTYPYRPIGGALPPMNPTPLPIAGGSPGSIQGAYNQAYTSALGQNQANYQNILSGYHQTAAAQRDASEALASGYAGLAGQARDASRDGLGQQLGVAQWYTDELGNVRGRAQDLAGRYEGLAGRQQPAYAQLGGQVQSRLDPMGAAARQFGGQAGGIESGYANLSSSVMGAIEGIGQSQRMDIDDSYARALGNTRSSMASRGLGNTTVRDAMERGNLFDRTRAGVDLADRLAAQRAQYGSQLGLAGLGFRERAAGRQADLTNQEAMARAGFESQLGQAGLAANERVGLADLAARERFGAQERDQANLRTGAYLGIRGDQANREGGYAMQAGLAGLGAQERGIDRGTNLAGRQLDFMNSVSSPYPDAGMYAALAAQAAAGRGPQGYQTVGQGGVTRSPSTGRGVPDSSLRGGGFAPGSYGFNQSAYGTLAADTAARGFRSDPTTGSVFTPQQAAGYGQSVRQAEQYNPQSLSYHGLGGLAGGAGAAAGAANVGRRQAAGGLIGGVGSAVGTDGAYIGGGTGYIGTGDQGGYTPLVTENPEAAGALLGGLGVAFPAGEAYSSGFDPGYDFSQDLNYADPYVPPELAYPDLGGYEFSY